MSLMFFHGGTRFEPTSGDEIHEMEDEIIEFGIHLTNAEAALRSFNFDYTSKDHHINIISTSVRMVEFNNFENEFIGAGTSIRYKIRVQFADKNFDDKFKAGIGVLIIADGEEVRRFPTMEIDENKTKNLGLAVDK